MSYISNHTRSIARRLKIQSATSTESSSAQHLYDFVTLDILEALDSVLENKDAVKLAKNEYDLDLKGMQSEFQEIKNLLEENFDIEKIWRR